MTIKSAIKQLNRMKMDMSHTGDEYNAITLAIKALQCCDALGTNTKSISDETYRLKSGRKGDDCVGC